MAVTRCPQCLQDALVQDQIALLHLRCFSCGCIVIPATGGPLFGCESCGRKRCGLRSRGVAIAHCNRWQSRYRRELEEEPELFEDDRCA